jgi:hypothetical protein
MGNRKTLLRSAAGWCALAGAVALMASPVWAKPNGPINATVVERASGCWVRDANGAYHLDANCEYMILEHRDRDGHLQHFRYRDHGRLPDGAPRPDTAQRITTPHPFCIGGYDERITPGGEYTSECQFRDHAF